MQSIIIKNIFFNIIFFVFLININLFPEKIDILQIRLDKVSNDLNLSEDQQKKMYEILKAEDEETKRPVYLYNIKGDSIDKIINLEKEKNNNKNDELKSFLNLDQYNQYIVIKSSSIKDKFTSYIIKELGLNPYQSVELNVALPVIVKKILIIKDAINSDENSSAKDDNSSKLVFKQINELLAVLEKEVVDQLDINEKKIYDGKIIEIRNYLQKDVLGFDDKPEQKNDRGNSSAGGGRRGGGMGGGGRGGPGIRM